MSTVYGSVVHPGSRSYYGRLGRFDHLATSPARGPRDMFRWKVLDRLTGRAKPDTTPFVIPREDDASIPDVASLTWIGHATFVLRLGGQVIATDPIWSSRINGVVPRLSPPGVPFAEVPPIDVVTISHSHYDHLDAPTLKRMPNALFVVPAGVARFVPAKDVVELEWWQSHTIGELTITLVPARHWSMRTLFDRNDSLWGGFVFSSPEGIAYHAGDTALFDGFSEIGERFAIDYAMLPIGAYEPRWFMEPQHMNPDDALSAFNMLNAKTLIAMHWGTFQLTDEPLAEPPERIRSLFGGAQDKLRVLKLGEAIVLD